MAIEPGLADALVADVEQEPGALPLLSTALFELWDEGLTLEAYERTGGVRGAVARLAEAVYERLDDSGRGTLTVTGPAAASGTITYTRTGARGVLDGRSFRLR